MSPTRKNLLHTCTYDNRHDDQPVQSHSLCLRSCCPLREWQGYQRSNMSIFFTEAKIYFFSPSDNIRVPKTGFLATWHK